MVFGLTLIVYCVIVPNAIVKRLLLKVEFIVWVAHTKNENLLVNYMVMFWGLLNNGVHIVLPVDIDYWELDWKQQQVADSQQLKPLTVQAVTNKLM